VPRRERHTTCLIYSRKMVGIIEAGGEVEVLGSWCRLGWDKQTGASSQQPHCANAGMQRTHVNATHASGILSSSSPRCNQSSVADFREVEDRITVRCDEIVVNTS